MKTYLFHIIPSLVMGVLLLAFNATSGELQRKHIAADSQWLIHLDADALKKTLTGQFIVEKLVLPQLKPQAAKLNLDANKLINQIHGITAYGGGFKGGDDTMAILLVDMEPALKSVIRGLLMQQLQASDDQNKSQVKLLNDGKTEIFSIHDEIYSILAQEGTVILGKNRHQIEKANALVQGTKTGLDGHDTFLDYPNAATGDFIMAAAENFNSQADMPPQAKFLQLAKGARLAAGESNQKVHLKINLKTESNQMANQVQAVVQGLIAFAMLSNQENSFSSLATGSQVVVNDRYVNLQVSIPVKDFIEKIRDETEGKSSGEKTGKL